MMERRYFFLFALAGSLAACSGGAGAPVGGALPPAMSAPQSALRPETSSDTKIKHVVIVIQENRSFNNLFATFPGADGATSGKNYEGKVVKLAETDLYDSKLYENSRKAFVVDYDGGKMDGWNLVFVNLVRCPTCAYAYVNPAQIQPYWTMAKEYVLADHLFPSENSGDFSSHQDLLRGDSAVNSHESLIDFPTHGPWGCDAQKGTTTPLLTDTEKYILKGPFPCMTYSTVRDLLDAKKVSWRYYAPQLFGGGLSGAYYNAFDAIRAVRYGPQWKRNVSMPETNVFEDIAKGSLAAVSWVAPSDANSDHAGFGKTDTGPAWVARVVNAIGKSKYWDSTAIVVVWDDWGGWYDNVPPPQLDYAGLGFRVPMIVVSPYAKAGYVSHTQYEFGSILRYIEDNWDLGRLGTTDTRATSIGDVFDYTQKPIKFRPIPEK